MGGSTHAHRPGRTDQALPLGCPPPGAFRPAGLSGSSPASGPPKPGCPVRYLPPLAVSPNAAGGQPTARTETTKEWHQGIDHERHDDRTTKYRELTTKDTTIEPRNTGNRPRKTRRSNHEIQGIDHERHDDRTTKYTKYTKKNNELTPARNHRSRCRIEPAALNLVGSADLHLFRVYGLSPC